MKKDHIRWFRLALVPFHVKRLPNKAHHKTYVSKAGAPFWLADSHSKRTQLAAYRALLQCRWLAPKVRNAIAAELGVSVREERRRSAKLQAEYWRLEIDELERRLREKGEQPHGTGTARIAELRSKPG